MPGRVLDVKGLLKALEIVRSSIKVNGAMCRAVGVLAAVVVHLHDCRMIG